MADPDPDDLAAGATMPSGSDPMASTIGSDEQSRGGVSIRQGELAPGSKLDRFTIEGRLGAGAMGVVYAAHDPELDRRIAIKLIKAGGPGDSLHTRLHREAQALARVAHPNVVVVYEVGTHEGQTFVAMELVRGDTLRGWLGKRPPQREILRVLVDAGRGLAAAHAADLVHRDFKPDNVLIGDDGRARVTDFGLARTSLEDPRSDAETVRDGGRDERRERPSMSPLYQALTETGMMVGTPVYASPEQLAGARVGAASDQFSFCITAWEALYGKRPFEATNLADLMMRVGAGTIAPPPRNGLPKRFERALVRGLRPDPDERHPSMNALLAELAVGRTRRLSIALGATIAAVGLGTGIAIAMRGGGDPRAACGDSAAPISAVWNAGVSTKMKDAFARSGNQLAGRTHEQLARRLDHYTADWSTARVTACNDARADGDLRRVRCLDQGLEVLRTILGDLTDPKISIEVAPLYVNNLEPIALCKHVAADPDGKSFGAVRDARMEISRARIAWLQNDRIGARRRLMALLAGSEAVRYAPLQAEIYAALGEVAMQEDDPARAVEHLRTALKIAEAAGDDRNKALVAIELLHALVARKDLEAAAQIADQAEATLKRLGGDPTSEARLAVRRARLAMARDRPEDAVPLLEQAIELFGRVDIELPTEALLELAQVKAKLGRIDEANELLAKVAKTIPATKGSSDSDGAFIELRRCEKVQLSGDVDRALEVCTAAVAAMKAARGEHDPLIGPAYTSLAVTHELRGEWAAARDSYLRAAAIYDKHNTPKPSQTAIEGAGRMSYELADYAAAIEHYRRAIGFAEKAGASGADGLVYSRNGLGRSLIANKQIAAGIAELEWVLPRFEVMSEPPRNALAMARMWLAEGLWQRNERGDRARARVLGETALTDAKAHRAKFSSDADPVNRIVRKRADALIAQASVWVGQH